jgi:hypothetical protein
MRSWIRFAKIDGLSLAMTLIAIAVVLAPESAYANLEQGHPEAYTNGVRMTTSKVAVFGHGTVHWKSEALGANIECVQVLWGYLHNEGAATFGTGQILGWTAQGDATNSGVAPQPSCKFTKTGVEGEPEASITDEPPIEATRRMPLSVPWNTRFVCTESGEATKRPLLRIGIPTGAPAPTAECPSEAVRGEQIAKEEAERAGCYATEVPEGCVKLTWLVPSLGLETTFEGTEQPVWSNAFGGGTHFSDWQLTGPQVGKLHLHGVFSTTAEPSGAVDENGFLQQMIQVK